MQELLEFEIPKILVIASILMELLSLESILGPVIEFIVD